MMLTSRNCKVNSRSWRGSLGAMDQNSITMSKKMRDAALMWAAGRSTSEKYSVWATGTLPIIAPRLKFRAMDLYLLATKAASTVGLQNPKEYQLLSK
eukprot:16061909-Heterocapsa_arctica.AAC.1